jgi:hypothetical protein
LRSASCSPACFSGNRLLICSEQKEGKTASMQGQELSVEPRQISHLRQQGCIPAARFAPTRLLICNDHRRKIHGEHAVPRAFQLAVDT